MSIFIRDIETGTITRYGGLAIAARILKCGYSNLTVNASRSDGSIVGGRYQAASCPDKLSRRSVTLSWERAKVHLTHRGETEVFQSITDVVGRYKEKGIPDLFFRIMGMLAAADPSHCIHLPDYGGFTLQLTLGVAYSGPFTLRLERSSVDYVVFQEGRPQTTLATRGLLYYLYQNYKELMPEPGISFYDAVRSILYTKYKNDHFAFGPIHFHRVSSDHSGERRSLLTFD